MFEMFSKIALYATPFHHEWLPEQVTNTIVFAGGVALVIIGFTQLALRDIQMVPRGLQNFVEFVIEFVYNFLEGILGNHLARRCFSFLITLFLFILVSNWSGLLPGVGAFGHSIEGYEGIKYPMMRPANTDVNITFAMALLFMIVWLYWTLSEVGLWGFIKHLFWPSAPFALIVKLCLLPIFLFVGVIELASIALRAVSLPFRLYGNVYAGENLLAAMMDLGYKMSAQMGLGDVGGFILSIIFPLPVYGLELLVGIVQAFVFMLLCTVYIKLSAEHHEEEGH